MSATEAPIVLALVDEADLTEYAVNFEMFTPVFSRTVLSHLPFVLEVIGLCS